MKKILIIVMITLLSLSLFACGGSNVSENSDPSSAESNESSQQSEPELTVPVINGTALSDYTIVYADTNETAKFRTAANVLRDTLKELYGVELKVISDSIPGSDAEIIVGVSKRPCDNELQVAAGYGDYTVAIEGTKVMIASKYASGSYQGVKAFLKMLDEAETLELGDQSFSGTGKVLKVACVGDSITQGINSSKPNEYTYPCFLQEMLGLDYYVLNAGVSGLSICKNDDLAYAKNAAYMQAKVLDPDIVIFALGTNDANPKIEKYPYKDWKDPNHDRAAEFLVSTRELLNTFKQLNSDVQIYLVYPASLFVVGDDHWRAEPWTENIVTYVRPLLEQIVDEYDLPTVDLFDWSKEHKDVFVDGLHPYDQSYKTLAEYIYENIKDTIKQPQ